MDYVKIDAKDWLEDLEECLRAHFSSLKAVNKDLPAHQLVQTYIEWAEKEYLGERVPMAKELADTYLADGEFLVRKEEKIAMKDWALHCIDRQCLFWNEDFACVTDGFYHVRKYY